MIILLIALGEPRQSPGRARALEEFVESVNANLERRLSKKKASKHPPNMETLAIPTGMLFSPTKTAYAFIVGDQAVVHPERGTGDLSVPVAAGPDQGLMPSPCNYRRRNVGKGGMVFPEDIYVRTDQQRESQGNESMNNHPDEAAHTRYGSS
jgi:hypothetical protein